MNMILQSEEWRVRLRCANSQNVINEIRSVQSGPAPYSSASPDEVLFNNPVQLTLDMKDVTNVVEFQRC